MFALKYGTPRPRIVNVVPIHHQTGRIDPGFAIHSIGPVISLLLSGCAASIGKYSADSCRTFPSIPIHDGIGRQTGTFFPFIQGYKSAEDQAATR
jgi:hypothetical protein